MKTRITRKYLLLNLFLLSLVLSVEVSGSQYLGLQPEIFSASALLPDTGLVVIGNTAHVSNKNNLIIRGNWVNNGSFNDKKGKVVIDGDLQIKGDSLTSFHNLLIENGKTLTAPSSGNLIITSNLTNEGKFDPNGGTLVLDANIAPGEYIEWDKGTNSTSIGTGGSVDFDVAIRFDITQLAQYNGKYLKKLSFFPNEISCSYSVRVWLGSNAASRIVDQYVSNPVIGEWNEITLDNPVQINASQELWLGYRCNTNTGFPAGCDMGPAYPYYGDMIYINGSWSSMYTSFGLNFNWNIKGYTEEGEIQQYIEGNEPCNFHNLLISPTSHTIFNTPGQTVEAILRCDGILNTNSNLTLLSGPLVTALVDGAGNGEIYGSVNIQRYLASGYGYHYICSPFSDATVGELSDDMNLYSTFPSFYTYDENQTYSGWSNWSNPGYPLFELQGYAVNFGDTLGPRTIDMKGTLNNGPIYSGDLFNFNHPFTQGFNLTGNPYPSPIDWDAAEGWTRSNIDDAVYYFNAGTADQYDGTYSSYVNGISSDGVAGNIIPAMQGFFIHVSDGTYPVMGSFTINNKARINEQNPYYHKNSDAQGYPYLRINASYTANGNHVDPLVIYLDETASSAFERDKDALKLMNTDAEVPNFYSLSSDNKKLSINAIAVNSDSICMIPLGFNAERAAEVIVNVTDFPVTESDMKIYLFDALKGTYQQVSPKSEFRVFVKSGFNGDRLFLVFTTREQGDLPLSKGNFFIYSHGAWVYTYPRLAPGEKAELSLTNMLGQVLWQHQLRGNELYKFNPQLNTGIYLLSLTSAQGIQTQKIFIKSK